MKHASPFCQTCDDLKKVSDQVTVDRSIVEIFRTLEKYPERISNDHQYADSHEENMEGFDSIKNALAKQSRKLLTGLLKEQYLVASDLLEHNQELRDKP